MDTEVKARNPIVRRRNSRPIESSRPEEVKVLGSGPVLIT